MDMKNRQEQQRQYYLKNRERILLINKNWSLNNKEKINEYQKKWQKENKEKFLRSQRKYYKSAHGKRKIKEYRDQNRTKFRAASFKYRNSPHGRQKNKEYKEQNREMIRFKDKEYYEKNKEEITRRHKIAVKKYKATAKGTETERRYYKENQEKIIAQRKKYYEENKEAICLRGKINYRKNKEKYKKAHKRWYENNREKRLKTSARYERKKYREDINFKIAFNLRRRLNAALSGKDKGISAVRDLGVSIKEFKIYLAERFYCHPLTGEKMMWNNYGYHGWHIDHKIPCSSFNLTDVEQQKKCFHYTNLQPLWALDNRQKGAKIIYGDITSPKT